MYTIVRMISTLAALAIPFRGLNTAMVFNLQDVTPLPTIFFVLLVLGTMERQMMADLLSVLNENIYVLVPVLLFLKVAFASVYLSNNAFPGFDVLLSKFTDINNKIVQCAGSSKSSSSRNTSSTRSNGTNGKKGLKANGDGNGGPPPPPPPPGPPPSEPPPPPPTKRSDVDEISEEVLSIFIECQALFAMVKQVYKLSRKAGLDKRLKANDHILAWLYALRVEVEKKAKSLGLSAAYRREPKHLYDFGIDEMYGLLDKILKYEDLCKRDLREHGEFLMDPAMAFVYRPMEDLREDIMAVLGSLSYMERERLVKEVEEARDAKKIDVAQSSPVSATQEITYLTPSPTTRITPTSSIEALSPFTPATSSSTSSTPSPLTPLSGDIKVKVKTDETSLLETKLDIPEDSFDWGYDNHLTEIPSFTKVLAKKRKGFLSNIFDETFPFGDFDSNVSECGASQDLIGASGSRKSFFPSFKGIAKKKDEDKDVDTRNILADLRDIPSPENTAPIINIVPALSPPSSKPTIPQSASVSKWFGERVRTLFGDRRGPQVASDCKIDTQNAPISSTPEEKNSSGVSLAIVTESVGEMVGVGEKITHVKANHDSGTEQLLPPNHSKEISSFNNAALTPLSMNHDVDIVHTDPQTRFDDQDALTEVVKLPTSLPGLGEFESELAYTIDRRRGFIFPPNPERDTLNDDVTPPPSFSPPSATLAPTPNIQAQDASNPLTKVALQITPNTPENNENGDVKKPVLLDQNKLHERWVSTAEVSKMPTEDYDGEEPLEVVVTFNNYPSPTPVEALPTFSEEPKPRRKFLISDDELAPYLKRVRACAVKTSTGVIYPGVPRVSDAELAPFREKARAMIAAQRPTSPDDGEPILPHSEFVKEMQKRLEQTRARALEGSVKVFFGRPLRASFAPKKDSLPPVIVEPAPASAVPPPPTLPTPPVLATPSPEAEVPVVKVATTTADSRLPHRRPSLPVSHNPQPTSSNGTADIAVSALSRNGTGPHSRLRPPASRRSSVLPSQGIFEQVTAPPPASASPADVPAVTPKVQPTGHLKRPSTGSATSRIATAPRSSLLVPPSSREGLVSKTAPPMTRTAPIKSMTTPTPSGGGLRKPAPRSSLRPPSITSVNVLRPKAPSTSSSPTPTTSSRPLKLRNQENIRPSSNNPKKTEGAGITQAQVTASPPKASPISAAATSKLRRPSVKGFSLLQAPKYSPKAQF